MGPPERRADNRGQAGGASPEGLRGQDRYRSTRQRGGGQLNRGHLLGFARDQERHVTELAEGRPLAGCENVPPLLSWRQDVGTWEVGRFEGTRPCSPGRPSPPGRTGPGHHRLPGSGRAEDDRRTGDRELEAARRPPGTYSGFPPAPAPALRPARMSRNTFCRRANCGSVESDLVQSTFQRNGGHDPPLPSGPDER